MIRLSRGISRKSIALAVLPLALACGQAKVRSEPNSQSGSIEDSAPSVTKATVENPFTKVALEESYQSCLTIAIQVTGGEPKALVTNQCDYPVALLTSPLEVRVRRTGTERLVNERMSWAVYAILYVFPASLGEEAFRGDGIIRDGGLRVRRSPGYTSIGGRESIAIPLRCTLDLPPDRYLLLLSTYEAPLESSPSRNDPLDCSHSVESWNERRSAAHTSLNRRVVRVPSVSGLLDLPGAQPPDQPHH